MTVFSVQRLILIVIVSIDKYLVFHYKQLFLFRVSMDKDTIFPVVSYGERIMGKYRNTACRQCVETIAIVTNFRLLIRWKHMICCCYTRSYYSSILLDSIDRIDETRPNRNWYIFFFVSGLLLGLIATILGFTIDLDWLKAIGIVAIVSTVVSFIVFFFCFKKKFITLTGTFGSETMRFEKTTARELEGQLSEMIHQRRIQCFLQQGNWHEPQPGPSLPIASTYFVETDRKQKKAAKIYAYDPSTYHY
jgi:hypothetical protein